MEKKTKKEEKEKIKRHVLVIDDNAILLRTVREMLGEFYTISIAASASQAFMAIEKSKPDIILLDYEMPYTDGENMLLRLRNNPFTADIPVIYFTGSADREVVTKLVRLNPEGYMLKPPNRDVMIKKIELTLNKDIIPEDIDVEDIINNKTE